VFAEDALRTLDEVRTELTSSEFELKRLSL
jgi:hypothetical protein